MKRLFILLFVLISLGSFGQGRIVVKVPSVTIPSSLPSMTGNAGKVLGTDGSTASWKHTTSYYYPEDYGALRDGTTNDAAAFQAAIDAMPSGGTLFLSTGTYLINTSVTISKPIRIMGQGGTELYNDNYRTKVKTTSATLDLFVVNSDNVEFDHVGFENTHATPTAGSAIKFNTAGDSFALTYCSFRNFYDNVNVVNGGYWSIDRCHFQSWRRYALRVEYVNLPDGGDMMISDSWFISGDMTGSYAPIAAIYQISGGGMKVNNCKFVGYVVGGKMQYCYLSLINSNTVDLVFTGNSFEGYTKAAVKVEAASGQYFANIVVTGNQLAGPTGADGDVILKNIKGAVVAGNSFTAEITNTAATPAISVQSCNDIEIGVNQYFNYVNPVAVTGSTNVSVIRPNRTQTASTGSFYIANGKNANIPLDASKTIAITGLVEGDEGTIKATNSGGNGFTFPSGSIVKGKIDSTAGALNLIRYNYIGSQLIFDIVGSTSTASSGGSSGGSSTAYQFSGADQSIAVASGGDFNFAYNQPFTIGFRFRVSDGGIVRISTSDNTQEGILVQANGSDPSLPGQVQCSFYLANTGSTATKFRSTIGPSLLAVDTWNKAAFVYDGLGNMNIYINGVLTSMGTNDVGTLSEIFGAGVLKIGQQRGTFHSTGALLDELFIVNRALNLSEIGEAYNNGNPIDIDALTFYANVVDGWQFDNNLNSVRGTHNGTATTPQYQ